MSTTSDKKYHYVYQTKNMVNGKTYIGVHSTDNLNDGYIGCGMYSQAYERSYTKAKVNSQLIRAVKKYGYDKFKVEILSFYDTREEAFEEEIFIVTREWVKNPSNYNSTTGGKGGGLIKDSIVKEFKSEIVDMYTEGQSIRQIAEFYKVSTPTIQRITKYIDKTKRVQKETKKSLYEEQVKLFKYNLKIVVLTEDGKYSITSNYKEAEKITGIKSNTIRQRVNSKYKQKTYPIFSKLNDFLNKKEDKQSPKIRETKYTDLIIEHILGEKKIVTNSYQLAKELGVSEVETRYVLSGKRGRVGWWYLSGAKTLEKDREKYLRYIKDPEGHKIQVLSIIQYGLKKYCGDKDLKVEPFCGILYGYRNYYKGYTQWQETN